MSIFLTLFIISLISISVMVGRKVYMLKNTQVVYTHDFAIEVPDLKEVGQMANQSWKKYSYLALVLTLRAYLISFNFLKKKYKVLKNKIRNIKRRDNKVNTVQKEIEANKFLKMMSDYKKKIKKIKKRIKEEEGLN